MKRDEKKERHIMRKSLCFLMALIMLLSVSACGSGGKDKKAFEASKAAYNNVDAAYEITEKMGSDVYEAWRLGIYDDDEIIADGCSYLAKELNLSEDELKMGVAYSLTQVMGEDWDELSESDRNKYINIADSSFSIMEDDLFSWCVTVVSNSYIVNGKAGEAQEYLNAAKAQMKDLSSNYSDYEHYPALKGYYTTTSSFFEFCQNPKGSFEQIKTTIENYRTSARDYNADLDYIFED